MSNVFTHFSKRRFVSLASVHISMRSMFIYSVFNRGNMLVYLKQFYTWSRDFNDVLALCQDEVELSRLGGGKCVYMLVYLHLHTGE